MEERRTRERGEESQPIVREWVGRIAKKLLNGGGKSD